MELYIFDKEVKGLENYCKKKLVYDFKLQYFFISSIYISKENLNKIHKDLNKQ